MEVGADRRPVNDPGHCEPPGDQIAAQVPEDQPADEDDLAVVGGDSPVHEHRDEAQGGCGH